MLTKEQFIEAMKFFDDFNNLSDKVNNLVDGLFEGNGLIFTGCDNLYNRYLDLLKLAMGIDLDDENDPISFYLYESSDSVYSEPNEAGICEYIGKKDYKFCTVYMDKKRVEIKNSEDLYNYIKYLFE